MILCLFTQLTWAQSNISTNRIVIKDSLSLDGKWIKRINNDSTLQTAGEQSVSTDGAIKKYIDNATSGGGGVSPSEIAKMMMNPDALDVVVRFWTGQWMTPLINFNLSFLSSDGIKSTYYVSGYHPKETFPVYGKPPFSLYVAIQNVTTDSVLAINLSTTEQSSVIGYENYSNFVLIKPGNTAVITADRLRGNLLIGIESWLRTYPENHLISVNERVKNHSATQSINMYKSGYGNIILMPGQEISQPNLWLDQNGYKECSLQGFDFHTAINGKYITAVPITSSIRFKVYRNSVLYMTKEVHAFKDDNLVFEIDPTWTDYEIILEDI